MRFKIIKLNSTEYYLPNLKLVHTATATAYF